MLTAESPDKLIELCIKLDKQNKKGVLISGGCDEAGAVKLENFLKAIETISVSTNLLLNVHTGLIHSSLIPKLAASGVNIVSFDVVGARSTIQKVYGLEHEPVDYQERLLELNNSGIKKIVPHICIGLENGNIIGEFSAIDIASSIQPSSLVFIILIPTQGTKMAYYDPPKIHEVKEIIEYAQERCPTSKLYLGCMRPRSSKFRKYNEMLEETMVRTGIHGIVLPTKATLEYLKKKDYKIKYHETCCAIV
jgi:uncharacterized radical SAM superfamily protein